MYLPNAAGCAMAQYVEVIERTTKPKEKPHRNATRREEGRGVHICPEISRSMGEKRVSKVTQQIVVLKEGQDPQTPPTHNDARGNWG